MRPPFVPSFEPEVEWHWSGSVILPSHNQVMMTPVVVEVSGDGVPDVVFNSFAEGNHTTDGVLRAISGADGRDLWAVTDPAFRVRGSANIAAGDLDHDGLVELCTVPESGSGIICFENDGRFKFRASGAGFESGGPSLADLDGDGEVEILAGNHVYARTGARRWVGVDGVGGNGVGPISLAADIDQDGRLEVVNDRAIYRHDGTLKCVNTTIGHGFAGVGNFDADPYGEVVVVWSGRVSLLDDDCRLLWTASLPGGGDGGPPNIADFDGDGQPEVGVAGASRYAVFEANGTVRWTSPTQGGSSGRTGSATFDFEGDGRAEVVYADELRLRIYDGRTGAVRFETPHGSRTTHENPVIADVDGDDNAEIIVASNGSRSPAVTGIRAFRDRRDGWVNTRRIWNQHAYAVTGVNDDGAIPARPQTGWLLPGLNILRSNRQGTSTTSAYAAPDLVASEVRSACDRATRTLRLQALVRNQGHAAISAGLPVAFYRQDPSTGWGLLGVATLAGVLPPGASAVAELGFATPPGSSARIRAVADDDGTGTGREGECREDNNGSLGQLNLDCSTNAPPVARCRDVVVSAGSNCRALARIDDGSYDPDGQPAPLTLMQSPSAPLGPGTHRVTLTISDGLESASCSASVTVIDTTPPVLACPAEMRFDCASGGAVASFSPAASDNCGAVATVCQPALGASFPLGSTPITCETVDGAGNRASCQLNVTVGDYKSPTAGADQRLVLWPPDHRYETVTLAECAGAAEDLCAGPLTPGEYGRITHVTSDEPEDENGDGSTCDDIVLTSPTSVGLRAERMGGANGRVYTVHYELRDPAGNLSLGRCTVSVPHDRSDSNSFDSGPAYCVGTG